MIIRKLDEIDSSNWLEDRTIEEQARKSIIQQQSK